MSFSVTVAAKGFLAWWSSMTTSIFLPFTPPAAFISSTARVYAFLNLSPNGASEPVIGWGAPIFKVSCARTLPTHTANTRISRLAKNFLHITSDLLDGDLGMDLLRAERGAVS